MKISFFKKLLFSFFIFLCNTTFATNSKLLFAVPFVMSNVVLCGYCFASMYAHHKNSQKLTKKELCKSLLLVGAGVISVGYSAAIILDNLN